MLPGNDNENDNDSGLLGGTGPDLDPGPDLGGASDSGPSASDPAPKGRGRRVTGVRAVGDASQANSDLLDQIKGALESLKVDLPALVVLPASQCKAAFARVDAIIALIPPDEQV